MTLPPREPPSALTTTAGLESSMRLARLWLAKPPNTTEWIAPSRTAASIANTASGIIGMYSSTRSPCLTPSDCSTAAMRCTSACSSRKLYACSLPTSVDTHTSAFWSGRSLRWRSTALWHRLVSPPGNQRTKGARL